MRLLFAALMLAPLTAAAKPIKIVVPEHVFAHDDTFGDVIVPNPPTKPVTVTIFADSSCDPQIFLLEPPVRRGMWISGEGLFDTDVFGIVIIEDESTPILPWVAGGLLGAAAMFVASRRRRIHHQLGELI